MIIRSPWLISAFVLVLITEVIKQFIDFYDASSVLDVGWTYYTPHTSFWDSITPYQWAVVANLCAYAIFLFVLVLNIHARSRKKHQAEPWK